MNEKLPITPKLLTWARETTGYSVEQVAKRLKKNPDEIRKWENGDSTPTVSQLERLAYDIYKRPLAVFFLNTIPKEPNLKSELRTLPESEIDSFSIIFRKNIRETRDKQYALQELFPLGNPSSEYLLSKFHFEKSRPEQSAQNLRDFLNISIELQQSFKKPEDAFKYYRNLLAEYGIYIFQYSLPHDIRGFCLYDKDFPVSTISSQDWPNGKIFTIFHELAHLFFKTSGVTKQKEAISFRNPESKEIEIACNRFAADVLVPKRILLRMPVVRDKKDTVWDIESLKGIAKVFNVSVEVILRRLLDLNLATRKQYEDYRQGMPRRRKPKGGPEYGVRIVTQLGPNFVRAVFSQLRTNKINALEASDYLNVKVDFFQKLQGALVPK